MWEPDPLSWWASLKHEGLLLAPDRLAEVFPDAMAPLGWKTAERLRGALAEHVPDGRVPAALLDTVLEEVLALGRPLQPETGRWLKGSALGAEWTQRALSGEAVKPQRVWQGDFGAELPLFTDTERRIGIGRGRRMPARVIEWLRAMGRPLALLTNGRQWRLIHATLDAEAYAEWDIGLWFEEGEPGPQVTALRVLLSRDCLTPPTENEPSPLLAAIAASRKGQGELSASLGERVRRAVELLIRQVFVDEALPLGLQPDDSTRKDIYRAATRVVMRMVVVLFAEAREDLLPRGNPIYHQSYGLQGLREALQQAGAGTRDGLARLAHRRSAWVRVLSLFRLIFHGSPHKDLTLRRYGGGLFEPGEPNAADTLRRALAALEDPHRGPSDADVYRMLDFLCITEVRVRQGKTARRVPIPVDFSDLSSEYIGILYEGLLDYELRRAAPGDPIVFLNLGDQPALPLSRLEKMDDKALANLVEKLKVKGAKAGDESEEESEEADDDGGDEELGGEQADEPDSGDAEDAAGSAEDGDDSRRSAEEQAQRWARRAVMAGKLVRKPASKKKDALERYEADVGAAARSLIARTVLPGEWFLVRWGGTRKGAGTFYTRPALAVPTVHRTLRALAYDPPLKGGKPDEDAPAAEWTAKKPEEILALKVCDPAMGSGSFLVASLRFLTEALYAGLHHHGRIAAQGDRTLVTLAEGKASEDKLIEEPLPCRPDDDSFEPRLRAILKRYVVERCLYGVDLDPLAVELGRLALWVETLDRDLPFEFLDHKLKVGNSLVGCWFDSFRDYPVMAWEREGGDKSHVNGVHFAKEGWTKAIKAVRNGAVKRELIELIGRQITIDDHIEGTPESLHDDAFQALETIHRMPIFDAEGRAKHYREHLRDNLALQQLRAAFDLWCAVWFWPADQLDTAPTPRTFGRLSDTQRGIVHDLYREHRFFHWEIEFPDVFCEQRIVTESADGAEPPHSGFDAIIGNPPWENLQANPAEFFSNWDPLFRTYGRLECQRVQSDLFASSRNLERLWLNYSTRFRDYGNWVRFCGFPFGNPQEGQDVATFSFGRGTAELHREWRNRRGSFSGYGDPAHPFRHQSGGRVFTHKLFSEVCYSLLRHSGRLGIVVPSSLYTDYGTAGLRKLFIERCAWDQLYAFQNERFAFSGIHHGFKIAMLTARKGGKTKAILTRFRLGPGDSPEPHELEADILDLDRHLLLPAHRIERFSPCTRAILEIRNKRDLEVLEKIYAGSVLLGDDSEKGWGINYALEFMMNSDSKLFPPRPWWEEQGYVPDEYSRWIKFKGSPNPKKRELEIGWIRLRDGAGSVAESDIEDIALPLYEGRTIGQFDFSQKGWVSGKGRAAIWREIPWESKVIAPQYLMAQENYFKNSARAHGTKVSHMRVGSATNERSAGAVTIEGVPTGDTAAVFWTADIHLDLALSAILNSYAFDFLMRLRLGGLHLDYHVFEQNPLPHPALARGSFSSQEILSLSVPAPTWAPMWLRLRARIRPWQRLWALTRHERLRLEARLNAIAALTFGLDVTDLHWIMQDSDHPIDIATRSDFARGHNPKGFWRVDKERDPEMRHTVLFLVAFHDLTQVIRAHGGDRDKGIAAFLDQNDGEGWLLPETLCLADYGLGHDERAKKPQPVRARLGDRFLPSQLEQSVEESWKECEIHARNILGEAGFAKLQRKLRGETDEPVTDQKMVADPPATYGKGAQRRLFPGQHTLFGGQMEDPPPRRRK